jgi:hypothetical protein
MRSLPSKLLLSSIVLVTSACGVSIGDGSDGGPSTCPDPNDPEVQYVSDDPAFCAAATIGCADGQAPFNDECGCGCVGPEPTPLPPGCPDPADPDVHYVSQDPSVCAAAFFACGPEQESFDDACGCGCIGPATPTCPDPNDPNVHYISDDPATCAAADFACAATQTAFDDECGCGCIGPATPSCPDPNDPAVHYVSHDPSECLAIDYACAEWQSYFGPEEGGCGCGCIDTACYGLDESACSTSAVCRPTYQGICDCTCENGEPGCAECPAACFIYDGCAFAGE